MYSSEYCYHSVWGILTGKGVIDSTASVVLHDVREIETWILRLLSAPVPVPGKTRVEVSTVKIYYTYKLV